MITTLRKQLAALSTLVLTLLMLFASTAEAATYYVRTDGNNANSGTGPGVGSAWATINHAAAQSLVAGDMVFVKAGTYNEQLDFALAGNSTSPIRFLGDKLGSVTGWDPGDVVVQASTSYALRVVSDSHLVFANFHFRGTSTTDTVLVTGSTGIILQECEISVGSTGVLTSGSTLQLANCLIHNNTSHGIDSSSGTLDCQHVTTVDNGGSGFRLPNTTVTVRNCIAANNAAWGLFVSGGFVSHSYNLLFGNATANFSGTAASTGEIEIDPQFVSASDYRLQVTSSAINAGTDASGVTTTDFLGTARPQDGGWDMGAYEYGSGVASTNPLVAHWKLDETSGAVATDSSGNGNDGTFVGSPTLGVSATRGTAVTLTDEAAHMVSGTSPELDSLGASDADFTIAFWVKPVNGASGSYRPLFYKGVDGTDRKPGIWLDNTTNRITVQIGTTTSNDEGSNQYSTQSIPLNAWSHVAVVKSGNNCDVYINGVVDYSFTLTGQTVGNTSPVYLGSEHGTVSSGSYAMDDVRVYGEALSLAEITELQTGLVGHWKLDETSGTLATDSSGAGNNGTYVGAPALAQSPATDQLETSVSFDGTDYVEIPGMMGEPESFTISAWVNLDSPDSSGSEVVSIGNMAILRLSDGAAVNFLHYDGTAHTKVSSARLTQLTGWHHVSVSFDDGNDLITLYLDGEIVATQTVTSSVSFPDGTPVTRIASHPTNNGFDFVGSIDDVRIYNYVLTHGEVTDLSGLIGHWKLNEVSGTTAADSSGAERTGSYTGGVTLNQSGPYPGEGAVAAQFDGADDEVTLPAIDANLSTGFSAAMWVKATAAPTSPGYTAFLDISNGGDTDQVWLGWVNLVGFQLYMTDTSDSSTLRTIEDNTDMKIGEWTHYVATVDSDGNATLYRNGQIVKQGYTSTPTNVSRTSATIGTSPFNDNFAGSIYDVRLYNRTITPVDVAELYGLVGHWKLDEDTGNTAIDASGMGSNGTYQGGTAPGGSGPFPGPGYNAAEFEGNSGDKIALPAMDFDYSRGVSMAVWYKAETITGTYTDFMSLSNGSVVDDIWFGLHNSSGLNLFLSDTQDGSAFRDIIENVVPETGVWHHVAATVDSAGNATLYRNGKVVKTGFVSLPPIKNRSSNGIGETTFGHTIEGLLHDARIYNRAISHAEVAELYGQVGHYEFEETSGNVANDSSGKDNHGIYVNSPTLNQTSNSNTSLGKAVRLDGTNYIQVPGMFHEPTSMTIMGWARLDQSDTYAGDLVSIGDHMTLRLDDSANNSGKSVAFHRSSSSWVFADGNLAHGGSGWHHMAAVYNEFDNLFDYYIDGVLISSVTVTNPLNWAGLGSNTYFGRNGNDGNPQTGFDFIGRLDDVRIFNRALYAEEIQRLQTGTKTPGLRILKWVEVR